MICNLPSATSPGRTAGNHLVKVHPSTPLLPPRIPPGAPVLRLVVCCFLVSAAPSALAQVPSGLVAAYGFSEGSGAVTADVSGRGNNGTISNALWSGAGRYGTALSFNGTSSRVTVPDSASLDL